MLIMHLQCLLKDNKFIYKLDDIKYFIAFKNSLYNIKKKLSEEGIKDTDYLTETIPVTAALSTTINNYQPITPITNTITHTITHTTHNFQ